METAHGLDSAQVDRLAGVETIWKASRRAWACSITAAVCRLLALDGLEDRGCPITAPVVPCYLLPATCDLRPATCYYLSPLTLSTTHSHTTTTSHYPTAHHPRLSRQPCSPPSLRPDAAPTPGISSPLRLSSGCAPAVARPLNPRVPRRRCRVAHRNCHETLLLLPVAPSANVATRPLQRRFLLLSAPSFL